MTLPVEQQREARARRSAASRRAADVTRRMKAIRERIGTPAPAPVDGSIRDILDRLRAHGVESEPIRSIEGVDVFEVPE